MKKLITLGMCLALITAVYAQPVITDGLIQFAGRQADIVGQNNTKGLVPIADMSGDLGRYGVGAYEGLDGEITIFEGRPYVTQVRDDNIIMRHDVEGAAIFAAWTAHDAWRDLAIPDDINSYVDLQLFVRHQAVAAGINPSETAFPFLITGRPAELQWHINVDKTEGQVVTRELFQASKINYVMQQEEVSIVGLYSELHLGAFIGTYAPAMGSSGETNALHLHLVSADGLRAGHIDDLRFEGGMVLRLPQ